MVTLSAALVADTVVMAKSIDLNADLGEGCGDDAALLDVVSSANIACGGHAGGGALLEEAIRLAVAKGVRIGAHPSYPDLENFGRLSLYTTTTKDLIGSLVEQILLVGYSAAREGAHVQYVKPHGALYNDAAAREDVAYAVMEAVARASDILSDAEAMLNRNEILPIMGLPQSCLSMVCEREGIVFISEAFADRGYLPDGTLVPRAQDGALLGTVQEVTAQVLKIVKESSVTSVEGSEVPLIANSICLHGDTPGAVEMARAVLSALEEAGIQVRASV